MKRTRFRFLAASSLILAMLLASAVAHTARRPRYGGTLRVEMQAAAVTSLDPATPVTDSGGAVVREKLMALVFDTLTRLDGTGRAVPALALSWQSDASSKHWEFRVRSNVKFQDGTPLTQEAIAQSVAAANPGWHASVAGYGVVIETDAPVPDLPILLAGSRYAIIRRASDGSPVGTGPFRLTEWQPGRRAVFVANEENWEGRPFLDKIEVQMGRPPSDQLIDLQVGKADLVEIPPDQLRRATERGAHVWASAPVELLALVFIPGWAAADDARVREALARSIDRGALTNFLLQKQGEPAGGLLPQWLSGYEFLFSTAADPGRARQLWGTISPVPPPVVLGYDASDPLERAVAERIALNARDAGIVVTTQALTASPPNMDARLVRLRIASPEPRTALTALQAVLAPSLDAASVALLPDRATPEELYARERAIVDGFRAIPLVHLPEAYGLSPQVKDWMPLSWGAWRLADVWLDLPSGEAR